MGHGMGLRGHLALRTGDVESQVALHQDTECDYLALLRWGANTRHDNELDRGVCFAHDSVKGGSDAVQHGLDLQHVSITSNLSGM